MKTKSNRPRRSTKVTVSLDETLLGQIDQLVQQEQFLSRSAAMEAAITQLLDAQADARFEQALDSVTEQDWKEMQAMADEGLADYAKGLEEFPWQN